MAALTVSRKQPLAATKRDAWDMIESATLTLTREELRAIYILCGDVYGVQSGGAGAATGRIYDAIKDTEITGEDGSSLFSSKFLTTRGPDGEYGIIFYEKTVIEEKEHNDRKAR